MDRISKKLIKKIQKKGKSGKFRVTFHAEQERDADQITAKEIQEVLLCDNMEILEEYKDDPRGESFLMLGFTKEDAPIHIVGALYEDMLIVITIYRPKPDLWKNYKTRRKIKL